MLKEIWHYAIQTDRVNRMQRAVTTFVHAFNAVDDKISLFSSPFRFFSQYGSDNIFVVVISSYLKFWIKLCQISTFISEFMILRI